MTNPHPHGPFPGLWLPLITPFLGNAVDHAALARLVQHYCKTSIAGLVACGSTGEAAALDEGEQLAVLDTILKAVQQNKPGLPVVMGLSGRTADRLRHSAAHRGGYRHGNFAEVGSTSEHQRCERLRPGYRQNPCADC